MSMLVELTAESHGQSAIVKNAPLIFAARSHMLNLQVTEVSKMISDVPVFFSRSHDNGQWLLSALCSFVPGKNLFVQNNQWLAGFQPLCMQTYPLSLLKPKAPQLSVVLDKDVLCMSSDNGAMPLFSAQGQPSAFQRQQRNLLETGYHHDYLTHQFMKTITELGLIKELDLHMLHSDGQSQIIKGLATVDEDKLQILVAEQLYQLHQQGYLLTLHAMLLSISQLNKLITLHNRLCSEHDTFSKSSGLLKNVRLELSRSQH